MAYVWYLGHGFAVACRLSDRSTPSSLNCSSSLKWRSTAALAAAADAADVVQNEDGCLYFGSSLSKKLPASSSKVTSSAVHLVVTAVSADVADGDNDVAEYLDRCCHLVSE